MEQKRRILAVSFGTSFPDAREASIGGIEKALSAAFGGDKVYRCFTSGMVIHHIKASEGLEIDDPQKALERAVQEGVSELLIQPTHIMKGAEFQKFMNVLEKYKEQFRSVKVGDPLLSTEKDLDALTNVLQQMIGGLREASDAVVLVGHGSETQADQVYGKLQEKLIEKGGRNVYVGTLESSPGVEEIRKILQKEPEIRRVALLPLMVVAGDHAVNDIAGQDNSWKAARESAGYEVKAVLAGLGEYPAVQKLYAEHLRRAEGE